MEKISVYNSYEDDSYDEAAYEYEAEDYASYNEFDEPDYDGYEETPYYSERPRPADDYIQYGDPSIIYYDEIEAAVETRFWTARRVMITIIVIIMIVAFIAQLAWPLIQSSGGGGAVMPGGPTPTALPMI